MQRKHRWLSGKTANLHFSEITSPNNLLAEGGEIRRVGKFAATKLDSIFALQTNRIQFDPFVFTLTCANQADHFRKIQIDSFSAKPSIER